MFVNLNRLLCFFLTFLLPVSKACFSRTQSIAVEGRLICEGQPAIGTRLRLYDEDIPDNDDLLDSGEVDAYGNFYLSGYTDEISDIDPRLSIYSDCGDFEVPCLKRIDIYIPQSFINEEKAYDMGAINLNGNFDGQKRDCID